MALRKIFPNAKNLKIDESHPQLKGKNVSKSLSKNIFKAYQNHVKYYVRTRKHNVGVCNILLDGIKKNFSKRQKFEI